MFWLLTLGSSAAHMDMPHDRVAGHGLCEGAKGRLKSNKGLAMACQKMIRSGMLNDGCC